jgi:hypothetical protein
MSLLTALAITYVAQGALIRDSFEQSTSGWKVLSPSYVLRRTSNAPDVREGEGALEMSYVFVEGQLPLVFREVGSLEGAGGISAWFKASRDAFLVILIAEKEEGERYTLPVYLPAQKWTKVVANLEDFQLADDSPVRNRSIDLDSVAAVGFVDLLPAFIRGEAMEYLFGPRTGTNVVWLDDFQIVEGKLVEGRSNGAGLVDAFNRPFSSWLPLLGITLTPTETAGMRVYYKREPNRFYAMLRSVSPGTLAGGKELVLKARAPQEIRFALGIEETDGEKWQAIGQLAGGNEVAEVVVRFAEMQKSEDSGSADGKLSPEKIKLITLSDITEAEPDTVGDFTLLRLSTR